MADSVGTKVNPLGVGTSPDQVTDWFRQQLLAALADPLFNVPKPFETWLVDRVAVSGLNIPIGQIVGFGQTTPILASAGTEGTTASTTYDDLDDVVGPQITGLPDGNYLVMFGAGEAFRTNLSGNIIMSVADNDNTASDDNLCMTSATDAVSIMRAAVFTLATGGDNKLIAKYRTSSASTTGNFLYRWLIAIKFSNL